MSVPQIPGFRIIKLLSEGRRSVLYLSEQESLQRPVALKILTGEMSGDEQSRKRLIEQEKSAARLTHPNILAVFDIGESAGRYYIATEYVTGGTLRDRLNQKSVALDQALAITRDLAQGLSFLHEQGFLHRDIKPSNVLFREDGTAVLGDSGITRMEDAAMMEVSFGAPHYMSPEQAQSQPCDGRSDLYSLGVVLFEMLSGRPPFDAEDPFQVAIKHISEAPPPLPPALAKLQPLVTRLLAKLPMERFGSAAQLVQVLEQALSRLAPQRPAPSPASNATTAMPVMAAPPPGIDPRATTVLSSAALGAATAAAAGPALPDPGATVINRPIAPPPLDPGATVVQRTLPEQRVPPPIDPGATVVQRPIDPGATTLQQAFVDPTPRPPVGPPADGATVVHAPYVPPAPPVEEDPATVRLPAADPGALGNLVEPAPPRRFEVPRYEDPKPKSRAWLWILLTLLLLGGAFAGWWFFLKDKRTPTITIPKAGGDQLAGTAEVGGTPAAGDIAALLDKSRRLEASGTWVASDGESAVSVLAEAHRLAPADPRVVATRAAQLASLKSAIAAARAEGQATKAMAYAEGAIQGYPDDAELKQILAQLQAE